MKQPYEKPTIELTKMTEIDVLSRSNENVFMRSEANGTGVIFDDFFVMSGQEGG